jgi:eukaryotic-like serine/threonine-protein kinase
VLAFGVSKTLVNAEAQGDVTKTAAMLGSPKYMSPEQMNDARTVDVRADIWSLGVVLYRLVTGQQPFGGDTIARLCMSVLSHDPPPITAHRPDAPPAFAAVVARCLEKDRARRFANVAELAAGLGAFCVDAERAQASIERIANVLGVPAPPIGWMPPALPEGTNPAWSAPKDGGTKTRPELVLAAAMVALLVALGAVGFVMLRKGPRATQASATSPPSSETAPVVTPPPSVVVASPSPTATVTTAEPTPATKPAAPLAKKPKPAPKPASAGNDGEPFPSDRK